MKYPKLKLICEYCLKPLEYYLASDKKTIKVIPCQQCLDAVKECAYNDGYDTACGDE